MEMKDVRVAVVDENEFDNAVTTALEETIREAKEKGTDIMVAIALSMSGAMFAARLKYQLFDKGESEDE